MFAKYYYDPLKGMKDRTLLGGDTLQDPNAGVDQTKITGSSATVCFPKNVSLPKRPTPHHEAKLASSTERTHMVRRLSPVPYTSRESLMLEVLSGSHKGLCGQNSPFIGLSLVGLFL